MIEFAIWYLIGLVSSLIFVGMYNYDTKEPVLSITINQILMVTFFSSFGIFTLVLIVVIVVGFLIDKMSDIFEEFTKKHGNKRFKLW